MTKKFRFSIDRALEDQEVTWTDKETKRKLTVGLEDIDEEFSAMSSHFFLCYGMQKFLEDRTSGIDTESKLDEREALWKNICEHGHGYKTPRTGGLHVVSVEVEAVAKVKGASVAQVQKAKKELSAEDWIGVIAHPDVVAAIAEIKEERQDAETLDLSDLTG